MQTLRGMDGRGASKPCIMQPVTAPQVETTAVQPAHVTDGFSMFHSAKWYQLLLIPIGISSPILAGDASAMSHKMSFLSLATLARYLPFLDQLRLTTGALWP